MEGCATLVHWDEVRPSADAAYQRARRLMTAETNAVIEGALGAGMASAIVNDSHSTMRNLIADELDQRAVMVTGRFKRLYMLEGLTTACAGAFFVGYHGAIGDRAAVMGHTYSPRVIFECRLNGEPVGELTINAAVAGEFGVPVVFVSGDSTTLDEARKNVPWAVCVETKTSVSYFAADSLSPAATLRALRSGAARAAALTDAIPFRFNGSIELEIDTQKTSHADVAELIPGMRRRAARTIAFVADDFATIYRALMNVIYLGSAA
jgi:D-amino peptidase